jgi:hypothetical protein
MISNRRNFLHRFTLLLTGLPFALQAQGQKECKSFKLTTTKVAGLQYNDASSIHFTDNQRLQYLAGWVDRYILRRKYERIS